MADCHFRSLFAANGQLPSETQLIGNYPNPFNPSTTISYAVSEDNHVIISIYDVLGQRVKTLVDEYQVAGFREISWDARNGFGSFVGNGVYFCRMLAGGAIDVRKLMLVK